MTEELKAHHYWREDRITGRLVVITPDEYEQWGKDNQPSEEYRPAFTRAQLPRQGGEAVAWREHSVNYAKGEKCPETIETLQAAWDRDQELINDMRHEIARHKTRINRLEQRRPADQVAQPDAELVRQCIAQELATWEGDFKGPVHTAMRCLQVRIDAKLASLEVKP